MRQYLNLDNPVVRALMGSGLLSLPLAMLALMVGLFLGPAERQVAITFFIYLIAVVGFGIYSGNTGVMTFGHAAFLGIAAYASGLLTMPVAIKEQALPRLPALLAGIELSIFPATLIALVVVLISAIAFGLPFSRLSAAATPIATLAMLMITRVVLVGAADITRGSQTFYGLPPAANLPLVLGGALLAIVVARLFRESIVGLRLRASREDELAAASMGVNVPILRLAAWLLSAVVVGLAGVLLAHSLTAFSPKQFYLILQFSLVAMLVVGGAATVTGAVVGAFGVSLLLEGARRSESMLNDFSLGPIRIDGFFGLQEIALGGLILMVMFWRRSGLFGTDEIDEVLLRWWRRRTGRSVAPSPDLPADDGPAAMRDKDEDAHA